MKKPEPYWRGESRLQPATISRSDEAPSSTSIVGDTVTNPVTSSDTTVSALVVDPAGTPTAGDTAFVETADGYMTAGAVSDSEWQGLTRALGHPEWLDDDRFRTAAGRVAYAKERLDQTADVLRTRTTAEWLELLDREQVPCAPILPLSEVIRHPQVVENGLLFESEHPVAGRLRQPRAAARFDRTPTAYERPAPRLGEHTQEILAELGMPTQTA